MKNKTHQDAMQLDVLCERDSNPHGSSAVLTIKLSQSNYNTESQA